MQFYYKILEIYPEFSTIFGPKQTSVNGASRHVAVAGLCVIVMESVNQNNRHREKGWTEIQQGFSSSLFFLNLWLTFDEFSKFEKCSK